MAADTDDIYRNFSADVAESAPLEVESMCISCHENGITRIMCTAIPYYKAIILMSFECPHCGYHNNEIQSGEAVQEHGTEIVLRVEQQIDLRRQLVKSEFALIEVPELELVIPHKSQPAEVTTVESVLQRVSANLSSEQDRRRELDPESAQKIDEFINRIERFLALEEKWTLRLRDPTGNCFIQNPDPRHVDPRAIVSHYHRSLEERKLLSLADDDEEEAAGSADDWTPETMKQEIMRFHTNCPNCNAPTDQLMKPTDIPFFQTVIIMSLKCDSCGFKTNEVKSAGAIRDQGCRLKLKIESDVDLARDVLKSDTCYLQIPELDLEVGPGALCGRFTTVEGILNATKDQIGTQSAFFMGDSADSKDRDNVDTFLEQFEDILSLRKPAHLVLDDPAGNSYIQSLTAPLEDPRLEKLFYTRSFDQNEELGLNDMKVENYGELDEIEEENEEETA